MKKVDKKYKTQMENVDIRPELKYHAVAHAEI